MIVIIIVKNSYRIQVINLTQFSFSNNQLTIINYNKLLRDLQLTCATLKIKY